MYLYDGTFHQDILCIPAIYWLPFHVVFMGKCPVVYETCDTDQQAPIASNFILIAVVKVSVFTSKL